jgi:hemoglobin-like flavoprotein
MALQYDTLRSSFSLVIEKEPELTTRFYEILFERYPQVRSMFSPERQKMQSRMLAQALAAVVDHLEDPDWLGETLEKMGARHVRYGVRDEMYGWVGESLLATLAEVAGDAWTPEIEGAWVEAYGAIAGLMQAGAQKAVAAQSAA